jgi:predicted N-acyltransferase
MLEDEPVAAAVFLASADTLYGRYWGAAAEYHSLHFETCYHQGIDYCIERGLARFEPGAGGDYKQLRGFDATPTWSCHFLADPRLRDAVGRFLARERAEAGRTLEWLTEHSALRRDDPARLPALRLRLSPPRGARPGARS